MRFVSGIVVLVYLLVGVLVANNHDYFRNVNDLNEIISAVLAVVLWPLVLLGVDLHLGNGKDNGKAGVVFALPATRAITSLARERGKREPVPSDVSARAHGPLSGARERPSGPVYAANDATVAGSRPRLRRSSCLTT